MLTTSMKQAEPPGHHNVAEAARALGRMTPADLQRAKLIAKARATGLRAVGWEDLLQEAMMRILEGNRRWPTGVPLIAFLVQTMRSIASDHRRRDGLMEDGDAVRETSAPMQLDERLDAANRIAQVETYFVGDRAVEHLIEGLIAGESAIQTQRRAGLSAQTYDAARKRYWRGIAKLNGGQR
jgi:DNA-directed RNA polymerase specialized sigma24 family protein